LASYPSCYSSQFSNMASQPSWRTRLTSGVVSNMLKKSPDADERNLSAASTNVDGTELHFRPKGVTEGQAGVLGYDGEEPANPMAARGDADIEYTNLRWW
jgi:hypothetical protein